MLLSAVLVPLRLKHQVSLSSKEGIELDVTLMRLFLLQQTGILGFPEKPTSPKDHQAMPEPT